MAVTRLAATCQKGGKVSGNMIGLEICGIGK
jgi:hypothetical protein